MTNQNNNDEDKQTGETLYIYAEEAQVNTTDKAPVIIAVCNKKGVWEQQLSYLEEDDYSRCCFVLGYN